MVELVAPGTDWVYRRRRYSPSERVEVLSSYPHKTHPRYDVRFVDDSAGRTENVPGGRLYGPWRVAAEIDRQLAEEEELNADSVDEVEEDALSRVFDALVPVELAEYTWAQVRYGALVHNADRLTEFLGYDVHVLANERTAFIQEGGDIWFSPRGAATIAELAARARPTALLDEVLKEENEYRDRARRGWRPSYERGGGIDPDWEYSYYLEHIKPTHELLRQWCGHRAVRDDERLRAAEAEVHRLDVLLTRAVDALRRRDQAILADAIEDEQIQERITAATVRPVVERPLAPNEIPVREVVRPRRWGS